MIDNPVRGRFNALFFGALDDYMHRKYADIKSRLFEKLSPLVVELGPGTGANLRYLPRGTRFVAIEPNRHMHPWLLRRARQCGIELDLRGGSGEKLHLPSASVDFVFSSLMLCSVGRPDQCIAEVRRVLRPGERFARVEHVLAPSGSAIRGVQHLVRRPRK